MQSSVELLDLPWVKWVAKASDPGSPAIFLQQHHAVCAFSAGVEQDTE